MTTPCTTPIRLQPPRRWFPLFRLMALLSLHLCSLPTRAEVEAYLVGLDVNCPSGLAE